VGVLFDAKWLGLLNVLARQHHNPARTCLPVPRLQIFPNQYEIRQARYCIGINQDVKTLFDFPANILQCRHPKAGADQCNGQNRIPFKVM
jgi:hypothetical protein